jgi:hypothetical protein
MAEFKGERPDWGQCLTAPFNEERRRDRSSGLRHNSRRKRIVFVKPPYDALPAIAICRNIRGRATDG